MEANELDSFRAVVPDGSGTLVPRITWHDKQVINQQTGFNRPLLEASVECGCFHCGRKFPTGLVTSWLTEPGEEDTGLCPYCGKDTLIVGTDEFPLTTALLTALYEEWFKEERDERRSAATRVPSFADHDDYLRKGIPFRWENGQALRQVAEIGIWSIGDPGEGRYDCDGAVEPGVYTDVPLGGVWHVRVWEEEVDDGLTDEEIEALSDEEYWNRVEVVDHYELSRDGVTVPFSPWSGDEETLLEKLAEEHGDSLVAMFKDCNFENLQLFLKSQ